MTVKPIYEHKIYLCTTKIFYVNDVDKSCSVRVTFNNYRLIKTVLNKLRSQKHIPITLRNQLLH